MRTTIRLYRESTERRSFARRRGRKCEPPYGSTERALKAGQRCGVHVEVVREPPYGSTERALKVKAFFEPVIDLRKEPPYGSTEGALKEQQAVRNAIRVNRTTIRLYRGSTERQPHKHQVIDEIVNHHTALQREH